jgi:hypothetical protein
VKLGLELTAEIVDWAVYRSENEDLVLDLELSIDNNIENHRLYNSYAMAFLKENDIYSVAGLQELQYTQVNLKVTNKKKIKLKF